MALALFAPSMSDNLARCSIRYSKWQLFSKLCNAGTAGIVINGYPCILQGIQREDGGGSSFILSVTHNGTYYSSYCRTSD